MFSSMYHIYDMTEYRFRQESDRIRESGLVQHGFAEFYVPKGMTLPVDNFVENVLAVITGVIGEVTWKELFNTSDPAILAQANPSHLVKVHVIDKQSSSRVYRFTLKCVEHIGQTAFARLKQAFLDKGFTLTADDDDGVNIKYAFPTQHGVDIVSRSFDMEPLDSIAANYEDETVRQIKGFIDESKTSSNGMAVIHGPPGTGKTHLIRAILTESLPNRVPVICNPPMEFMNKMGLLTSVMNMFDSSLIVLEDMGDVIARTSPGEHVQIYANLLNVTDGLLSLLSNAIVLMTFNTDIDGINDAILRPGRCLVNAEVGKLGADKVSELLKADGLGNLKLTRSEYSLAEVYEIKRRREIPKSLRKDSERRAGLI